MFGLGTTELVIILLIVIMLFGVGKLPMVAKELGSGLKSFKKSLNGEDDDDDDEIVEVLEKKAVASKEVQKETEAQRENW